jgi:hypothetical protein
MRYAIAIAAAIACCALPVRAQDMPPGTVVTSTAITGIAQFDTDLDSGGSFHWAGVIASASVYRQFAQRWGAGLSVQYDYQQWHFGNPVKFGGVAPWRDLYLPQVGATFMYALTEEWQVVVTPTVGWAYTNGASTGDALNYGAVVIASKDFSPTLNLGLGAAVFRQIDKTRVFPFLSVDWKIDDRWRLANPFQAGPAGGAGLELVYSPSEEWQAGFGGTYRSFAFRLAQDGAIPNGIGENSFIPVFVRLTRNIGKQAQVDLYGAALVNGTLKVKNQEGNQLARDDYGVAPAVALTFRYRF